MTLLGKMVRRPPGDLLLAAEALLLLILFRVCLALLPVRRIIRAITHTPATESTNAAETTQPATDAQADRATALARRVRWAVSAIARHSLVEFVCFPQTLAGYLMLRWRNVPSTMVYGVARSPQGELLAHTWLMVADTTVLGGEEASGFTPVERWR